MPGAYFKRYSTNKVRSRSTASSLVTVPIGPSSLAGKVSIVSLYLKRKPAINNKHKRIRRFLSASQTRKNNRNRAQRHEWVTWLPSAKLIGYHEMPLTTNTVFAYVHSQDIRKVFCWMQISRNWMIFSQTVKYFARCFEKHKASWVIIKEQNWNRGGGRYPPQNPPDVKVSALHRNLVGYD